MIRYSISCSLDGFIEDAEGNFGWSRPSEEVHQFVNDRLRSVETFVFGRRMYETMQVWETLDDPEPVMRDFAGIWHATDKIIFSRSLEEATTARTRLEREFDPEMIRSLEGDVGVGGAELAAHAFKAGLVDFIELYVYPVIVGAGKRALPADLRLDLRLVSTRLFPDGTVHVEYAR